MNSPTNTSKNAPLPIISEEDAETLTSAYHTIYALMASYGSAITVPVGKTGKAEWERAAARGFGALNARQAFLREQEVAAFRQGVRDAISPHIDAAREEKAEYDAAKAGMSEKVAKLMAAFPTYINVPLAAVSDAFGEGVDVQGQVKKLVDMGYKVAKGANNTYSLRVDLPKSIIGDTDSK
jgi:hypothetical protein